MEAYIGEEFEGIISSVTAWGMYVELPNTVEGMIHISKLANHRVEKVEDVVNIGDTVKVKVLEVDRMGKISLSLKDALEAPVEAE